MEPVGQLDHQHADVACHGDDHLAHRLGRRGVAVPDLVELGDAVDELGDLVAEVLAQGVEGVAGVLNRVVQERCRQRGCGHAEVGEDGRDGQRVRDVGLARTALLVAMEVGRHLVGALDDLGVGLGVVLAQGPKERLELGEARARSGQAGEPGPQAT